MAQVVADTSPLIALHQIGLLWLADALYREVVVPPAVAREMVPSLPTLPAFVRVEALTKPVPHEVFGTRLGAGESEAIALALEIGADRVMMDELRGRAVARRLNLKIVGTLGLLRSAKLVGHIPDPGRGRGGPAGDGNRRQLQGMNGRLGE